MTVFLFHFLQLKITVWFGIRRCVKLCAVAPVSPSPQVVTHELKTTNTEATTAQYVSLYHVNLYFLVLAHKCIKMTVMKVYLEFSCQC